jgi:septal ring factor EnvC (AmiA/AmiB activator)
VTSNPQALRIGQAYAMRAWIIWLQSRISKAQPEMERQINEHQREAARLRGALERSSSTLESLRTTLEQLDEILHNVHDTDIVAESARLVSSTRQGALPHTADPADGGSDVPGDNAKPRN